MKLTIEIEAIDRFNLWHALESIIGDIKDEAGPQSHKTEWVGKKIQWKIEGKEDAPKVEPARETLKAPMPHEAR